MDHGQKHRNAEATKATILHAAEQVFADKGFAGASIREISAKSGVSGALLLFHFQSKDSLYTAVKTAIMQRYAQGEPSGFNPEDPIDLYLSKWLSAVFNFYKDNPTMVRLANWGLLEGDADPWPGEDRLQHTFESRLKNAQKNGEIRTDISPMHLSVMLSGMAHIWWEYHAHFIKHSGADSPEADSCYLKQALAFVKRGIAPLDPGGI